MTCPVCSTVNSEGARICQHCGNALPEAGPGYGATAAPQSYGSPHSTDTPGQYPQQPSYPQQSQYPQYPQQSQYPQYPQQTPYPQQYGSDAPAGYPSGYEQAQHQAQAYEQTRQPGYGQQPGYGGYDPGAAQAAQPAQQPTAHQPDQWGQAAGHDQPQQANPHDQRPGYGQSGYPSAHQQTPQWGQAPAGYPSGYEQAQHQAQAYEQTRQPGYGQQPGYGGYDSGGVQAQQPTAHQPDQWGQWGQAPGYEPSDGYGQQPGYDQARYGGYDQNQPAYGQPAWSSPAPPKSGGNARIIILVAGVVAVLVVAGVVLALTKFNKKVFDSAALNKDIATQYNDRFGEKIEVDCPKNTQVKKGASFTCDIAGRDNTIEVKITSDDGDYTWRPSS